MSLLGTTWLKSTPRLRYYCSLNRFFLTDVQIFELLKVSLKNLSSSFISNLVKPLISINRYINAIISAMAKYASLFYEFLNLIFGYGTSLILRDRAIFAWSKHLTWHHLIRIFLYENLSYVVSKYSKNSNPDLRGLLAKCLNDH